MCFKMNIKTANGSVVITTLEDSINASNADAFLASALKISKTTTGNIVIDLSHTPSVDDVGGINKMMRLKTCIGVYGKSLSICNMNDIESKNNNAWIFKDLLNVHKDLESALTS